MGHRFVGAATEIITLYFVYKICFFLTLLQEKIQDPVEPSLVYNAHPFILSKKPLLALQIILQLPRKFLINLIMIYFIVLLYVLFALKV